MTILKGYGEYPAKYRSLIAAAALLASHLCKRILLVGKTFIQTIY